MQTEVRNKHGEKLDYAFHDGGTGKDFLVIIGHGVTGNKDRPWCEALGKGLGEAGINAVRFSFSGNGDSDGDFGDSTISKEVEDLGSMIDAARTVGYEKIAYAGHSMGGAVGVLRAATDERIDLLVSLAGMVHTAKFLKVEFGDQEPDKGFMWEDENCPLSSAFAKDMESIATVRGMAKDIKVPWLLLHGDVDDVVPVEESREIYEQADQSRTELLELPGVSHVFADYGLNPMVEAVTTWIQEHK